LRSDLNLVDSIGQALGIQVALLIRSECIAIFVALADELNRAPKAEPEGSVTLRRNSPLLLWLNNGMEIRIREP